MRMLDRRSNAPVRWEAKRRALFACIALLAIQATGQSAAAPENTTSTNPRTLLWSFADGSLYSAADAAQSQLQQTAAHAGSTFAGTSSGALQSRSVSGGQRYSGRSLLQSDDDEYGQTSTEDVDLVCFSRNFDGILDPTTGVFIDQGRTAEEVLAEMKEKSLEAGRVKAMDAFASMIEDGEINSSLIIEFFPTISVFFLVVAALIFLLLICCVGPLVCCRCCRFCCCCVRRKAHTKGSRFPCHLIFGCALALLAVVVAIAAYRVDKKALDEATAVVCAGGRSVDAVLYGTRTGNVGQVHEEGLGFEGIRNLLTRSRKLADAADGKNPNNMVNEVKEEVLEVLNIDNEKKGFKNAAAATSGNVQAAEKVTSSASHDNIFVKKHSSALLTALKTIDGELDKIDLTTDINDILQNIDLPSADLSVFDEAENLVDMLSDAAESVGRASVSAEGIVSTLDFALRCVSAFSGALVIIALITLIWELCRPNKCTRATLGVLTILMTILSVIVCITVAIVSLLHKVAMPVCDYAAVRFIDFNSDHFVAKVYGEDSAIFQVLSTCLSETGSGDLLEDDDGTNRIDPILEKLEEAKTDICNQIPEPPKVNLADLDSFATDARLQSWAVLLQNPSSFATFPQVQNSGIQEPDSLVPVDGKSTLVYGLGTVRELVRPWQVVISDSTNMGNLTVTSQAPSDDVLDEWFKTCSGTVQRDQPNCEKIKNAVLLLKNKIGMMVSDATCYRTSAGSQGTACTVTDLMGGVGGSKVPQNALDRSVSDAVNVVKQLKAKVEGSRDAACNIAANKISYIKGEVLKIKNGSNCKFARDRVIRLTNHLCYGAIDGLGTGSALYFLLAIVLLVFSLLLLILIVEDRDNDRYRNVQYTAAATDAAEPAQGTPEAVAVAPPPAAKDPENSSAIVAPEGDRDVPEEVSKVPHEEAPSGKSELNRASHSEGANEVTASGRTAHRMASIP